MDVLRYGSVNPDRPELHLLQRILGEVELMTLYEKIMSLYPDINQSDFWSGVIVLQNDGSGDIIAQWNHPTHPCPTDSELAAVTQPPSPPVPETISDRQFFQQAAIIGLITQTEALAAVQTGTVPAVLMSVVNGLPDQMQKFAAEMVLAGATVFERNHPLTEAVGAALGWTGEQIDAFFASAAGL